MKYGVIDVGSNSVRLMMSDGKNTLYKDVITTRLAEGMGTDFLLKAEPIERTARAVSFFVQKAKTELADEIFVFATAAVRRAKNKAVFLGAVKNLCGVDIDVISGENEALMGIKGALDGESGGVIDVGGASSEVITVTDGVINFSKSLYVGAVSVTDKCGQNSNIATEYIENIIKEYGQIPSVEFCAIGGAATTIAAVLQELEPYDPQKVDGFIVAIEDLELLLKRLYCLNIEERKKLKGLQPARAEVIANGVNILLLIMKKAGIFKIKISEKDNLEGYLIYKTEKK